MKKGFTLIEILLVVALLTILLSIVIIAINPARQFSQANDAQRRNDINALLNSMNQYQNDHRGSLPGYIPSTSTVMLGTGSVSGCGGVSCAGTSTQGACLDLTSYLVPTYIVGIPVDPTVGLASTTYYAVTKTSAEGNRITVSACGAELATTTISR